MFTPYLLCLPGGPGGPGGLEEEYNYAIASNIVQELLLRSRQQETAGSDTKISGLHSSASILNTGLCPLHSYVPSSSLSTPKTNKVTFPKAVTKGQKD